MREVDLNLLIVFDAVMAERNLRRAAERLNRSQPAVSQSIARLRDLWTDQLFRRTPRGVDPTPRAEAIWQDIRAPLRELRARLSPSGFVPAQVRSELRLGLSDDVHTLAFAEIVSALRRAAPHLKLRLIEVDHQSVWPQVESGFVDLAVSVCEPAPKGLAARIIHNQDFVVVRRADLPPPRTLKAYLAQAHVAVGFSYEQMGYTDRRLEALGVARNVIAWTPRFAAIPDLIMRTGALATMPEPIARFFARSGGVALSPLPFAQASVSISLCWHLRRHTDPLNAWAREVIEKTVEKNLTAALSSEARG